ncbi:MAG TPA: lytic transglycosylase domain-containing protein [Thermoanaerobaculia bacterium]|nr:lytic transglycosylase domain-containing protein [Thermoanaerobaculia bacterium]
MRMGLRVLALMVLTLLPSLAAANEVRIVVGPSGRPVILNENTVQRTRRLSAKLVDLPDTDLEPIIARHSDAQNLDPRLVRALIQAESGYNVKAVSNKGAIGLMQLMPETASDLNILNPYDPDQNIRGGTMYLRQMLDHFAGKVELAIAAYNAGPGAVEKHGGIPPFAETREYVKRVLALWRGAEASLPAAAAILLPGNHRKPYLIRGANNRLVLTTALTGSK